MSSGESHRVASMSDTEASALYSGLPVDLRAVGPTEPNFSSLQCSFLTKHVHRGTSEYSRASPNTI